jgi:predicted dehydrogenase
MKVRVAFIGFGRRGKTLYGSLIKKKNIEVVGVNDLKNTENVKCFFNDSKEMIRKVLPDLVIIATPPNLHRHYIEICDDLNVPVLCEKPVCNSLTDALSIRKDQRIYPAYQFLYDPIINKVFELMEKKQILKIVACQRVNNIATEWKSKKKNTGGGTLIDNGSHFISLAIHFFGMPSSVYASIT